ncbi:class I adenylate-forming enzyme family protein [Paenarthrobacter sp. NPDC058040]|uniref:class I adenylate-forming enzyme family protein n=1 Tax=unclassified Paenarthrobacter TaxID=2634190 RepID=UPI0036DAEA8E
MTQTPAAEDTDKRLAHQTSNGGSVPEETRGGLVYLEEFTRVALARPDATAIASDDRRITYGEMHQSVLQRAEALRLAGLQPGERVSLIAENSAAYVITSLAVWAAQGVLVTIYPSTAPADLAATIADSDPVLVLCDSVTDSVVRQSTREGLPVESIDGNFRPTKVASGTKANPEGLREPLHLVCYSSGTTSRPKAIMISESALHNGARTYAEVWGLTSDDVSIICLPMAWLYGLNSTTMATLLVGGTVVPLRRAKPEILAHAIEKYKATFFPAVTTIITKLVAFLEESAEQHDLSSLRLIVSGGEPRNEPAFDRFRKYSGVPVHDTFCASECFPLITYDPVRDPEPKHGAAGRLVPRSRLKVVNEAGNEVAVGEVGEALSQGPGLMLGYWNDPEQTAAALTPDGWYRTKDLVRVDEQGYVSVAGRKSDMIIRGGSNISPAEVEQVLKEHPSVDDVAVVGQPDPIYGEQVVAVIELANGEALDADGLRAFAAERLSAYKVPTVYKAIEQLPSNNTTQKVNRREVKKLLENGTI